MKKNIYFGAAVMFYRVLRSYGFSRSDVEKKSNKKYNKKNKNTRKRRKKKKGNKKEQKRLGKGGKEHK
jgi:hypothetical protein